MQVLKFLIVEDEPLLADQVEQLLRRYHIFLKFFKVKTGEEAMEVIHKEHPDIILLDIKLADYPAMDGMEVLEKLRKFDQKTDVIVMTALEDKSFEIGAKKLDARAFFRKPFEFKLLEVEIEQIIWERHNFIDGKKLRSIDDKNTDS